jgi:hypothetical protein
LAFWASRATLLLLRLNSSLDAHLPHLECDGAYIIGTELCKSACF